MFVQDPFVVRCINRWSSGNDSGEAKQMHHEKTGNLNGSWERFLAKSTLEICTHSCTVCD